MKEAQGRLRVKRSSSCAISIVELSQEGHHVKLSNGSQTKDFELSDWRLERRYPRSQTPSTFTFPKGFKLKPSAQVTIWCYDKRSSATGDDLVATERDCSKWGSGNGSLELKNKDGDVKASSTMTYELN